MTEPSQPRIIAGLNDSFTCSACGGFLRPDAKTCKHCGVSFVAQLTGAASQPAASTKKRSRLATLAIALGVLVAACALFYVTGLNRVVLGFLPPMEGQEAFIRVNGPSAIIAADLASYQAAGRVSTAELQQMEAGGKVFLVPNGTQVRVLEVTPEYTRVQVLSTGKVGLVPPSFVQR